MLLQTIKCLCVALDASLLMNAQITNVYFVFILFHLFQSLGSLPELRAYHTNLKCNISLKYKPELKAYDNEDSTRFKMPCLAEENGEGKRRKWGRATDLV